MANLPAWMKDSPILPRSVAQKVFVQPLVSTRFGVGIKPSVEPHLHQAVELAAPSRVQEQRHAGSNEILAITEHQARRSAVHGVTLEIKQPAQFGPHRAARTLIGQTLVQSIQPTRLGFRHQRDGHRASRRHRNSLSTEPGPVAPSTPIGASQLRVDRNVRAFHGQARVRQRFRGKSRISRVI